MTNQRFLFFFIIIFVIVSCSDSGNSDSSPTRTSPQLYDVTVSMTPSDGGTVTPSADSSYEEGSQVSLQANPTNAYTFSGWTGTIDTTANPFTFTVDKNHNFTANFQIKSYELTVNTTGEGTVTEQIIQQKTEYEHGTLVELTANPANGWKFVEWQGDVTGTNNPAQITVDDPKSVTAVFVKKTFPLTINISGNGNVTKSPDQVEYEFGTTVDLTANPDTDWEFETWDGDTTSTDNPLTISIDSAITITAVFTNPTFAGGNGTLEYPYQISTIDQLQAVNDYPSSHFIQKNDIDANATSTWNGGSGFKPIGDDIIKFTGSYDGQGFQVLGLMINRETADVIGLFSYLESGTIKNLNLKEFSLVGNSNVGGLIGINNGNVSNITLSGNISGNHRIGGLVGTNNKSVISSNFDGDISGNNRIGGLIGTNIGNIENSYSVGKVIGASSIGGLVGNNDGSIEGSHSQSDITVAGDGVIAGAGGLVGDNSGNITNAFAQGDVISNDEQLPDGMGGMVGVNDGEIVDSYSEGSVVGSASSSGGLIGYNSGNVTDSYASGNVSGENNIGGVVGTNNGSLKKVYSKGTIEGINSVGGIAGINSTGKIRNSYSNGKITGGIGVGGIAGSNGRYTNKSGSILYSYSKSEVNGQQSVGGVAGINKNSSIIKGTYASGNITGDTDIGGLVGTNGASSENTYWDTEATNQSNAVGSGSSDGATGLTTSEMTGTSAETNMSDFDFVNIWVTTSSYPALFWE